MTETRTRLLTKKLNTPFGNIYLHVGFDSLGQPCEISISMPGKHHDTGVQEALQAIAAGITAMMETPHDCDE